MRVFVALSLLMGAVLAPSKPAPPREAFRAPTRHAVRPTTAELNGVVKQYCGKCHNPTMRRGNLSLDAFDVGRAPLKADVSEKIVAKLRLGMMPPSGSARPSADTVDALVALLEHQLDSAAAANPNPGRRTFQRLNRAEYQSSVRALLGLDVDAAAYLPPDTKSENFDNIADVQMLSPTLLDGYLRAASDISWLALGNANATPLSHTYTMPKLASQLEHVDGAPFGTRGGMSVLHTFPADGDYRFDVNFFHETTGAFAGGLARGERIEISMDGERLALLNIDRFMTASDPNGVGMSTEPVRVSAGTHRISAAFIPPSFQGVAQDLISPLKYSLSSTSNATAYGFSQVPHLREFTVKGPLKVLGVSETATRRRVLSCRPATAAPNPSSIDSAWKPTAVHSRQMTGAVSSRCTTRAAQTAQDSRLVCVRCWKDCWPAPTLSFDLSGHRRMRPRAPRIDCAISTSRRGWRSSCGRRHPIVR
jgi:Protein of unknown function (DUF1587)